MEFQPTTISQIRDQDIEKEEEKNHSPSIPSTLQDSEEGMNNSAGQETTQEENDYVTGFKFIILMATVTLAVFLMLLDISIIVTVRTPIIILTAGITVFCWLTISVHI